MTGLPRFWAILFCLKLSQPFKLYSPCVATLLCRYPTLGVNHWKFHPKSSRPTKFYYSSVTTFWFIKAINLLARRSRFCQQLFRPIKFYFSFITSLTIMKAIYCTSLTFNNNHILKYLTCPCNKEMKKNCTG